MCVTLDEYSFRGRKHDIRRVCYCNDNRWPFGVAWLGSVEHWAQEEVKCKRLFFHKRLKT